MLVSVIVTTYNWPRALCYVLDSLECQTDKNFEIIIADDGSTSETQQVISNFISTSQLKVIHVWQEDIGFRAAAIRNKAVVKASGEYLIFIDGDSVVRPTFIRNHRTLAEQGFLVPGNRILLSKEFTEQLLKAPFPFFQWSLIEWFKNRMAGNCNRWLPFLEIPFSALRKVSPTQWKGAKTCNLALFKADFIKVNGFNEKYIGWGYEDSDLVIRLLNLGIKRKSGKYYVPILHLWHPESDRSNRDENYARLKALQESRQIWAEQGLDQHS